VSSRLRRAGGTRGTWQAPNGQSVDLPVVLDSVRIDEESGRLIWGVEARVELIEGEPRLVEVRISEERGLDTVKLQRFFRWNTPLDVVKRTVPELLRNGVDPFGHDYATDGYPDAADLSRSTTTRLSDSFLEELARQYLEVGRGSAGVIADHRGVSKRTVVSWIEKARKRGILSPVRPGQWGGRIVPREER
jgi:hypothetical protein